MNGGSGPKDKNFVVMDLKVLKGQIRALEQVFGNFHERFRVKAVSLDELTCVFLTPNGKKHEITGNITTTYPHTPPIWYAFGDSEDAAIISNTLEIMSTTTGTDNHIFSQIKLLLNVLCPAFGFPDLTHDLELLDLSAVENRVTTGLGTSSECSNSITGISNSKSGYSGLSSSEDCIRVNESIDAMEMEMDEGDGDGDEGLNMDFGVIEDTPPTSAESKVKEDGREGVKEIGNVSAITPPPDCKCSNRLLKELRQIFRSDSYKKGYFTVEVKDDSLHECSVRIKRTALLCNSLFLDGTDDEEFILLNITFNNYPMEPPFVRLAHPTVIGKNISSGGVVFTEILTKAGWKQEYTLEEVILEVSTVVVRTESPNLEFIDRVTWVPGQEGDVEVKAPNFLNTFSPVLVKTLAESECKDVVKPTALVSLPYSINLLEEMDYKHLVLQVLSDKSPSNRYMSELRIVLFAAAALDSKRQICLIPFPACFYDPILKCGKFDELVSHVKQIPAFTKIKDDTDLPSLTWQVLYWTLTNPLSLEPLLTNNIVRTMTELEKKTGLKLPFPDNEYVFMFNIVRTQPKKPFLEAKEKYGSTFAFHGSPIRNFHSIIHRGLISALNVRSAYGKGTYLSSALNVSTSYSSGSNLDIYCVAVCEVVKSPTLKRPHESYFVCAEDDYMQLSHIYLFKPKPPAPGTI